MYSDISNLLRETANNFVQLAEALEAEQKCTQSRIDYIERTACETKSTLQEAANLILSRL